MNRLTDPSALPPRERMAWADELQAFLTAMRPDVGDPVENERDWLNARVIAACVWTKAAEDAETEECGR